MKIPRGAPGKGGPHKGSWGDSYIIEQRPAQKQISCSNCYYYEEEDRSCWKRMVAIPEVGWDFWKYCKEFRLSNEFYSKEREATIKKIKGNGNWTGGIATAEEERSVINSEQKSRRPNRIPYEIVPYKNEHSKVKTNTDTNDEINIRDDFVLSNRNTFFLNRVNCLTGFSYTIEEFIKIKKSQMCIVDAYTYRGHNISLVFTKKGDKNKQSIFTDELVNSFRSKDRKRKVVPEINKMETNLSFVNKMIHIINYNPNLHGRILFENNYVIKTRQKEPNVIYLIGFEIVINEKMLGNL